MTALEIVPDDSLLASWGLEHIVYGLAQSRRRSRAADPRQFYAADLPSPEAIAVVVRSLRSVLFPRHAGGQDGSDPGLDYFVGFTLNTSLRALLEQVKREFLSQPDAARADKEPDAAALEIVREFAEGLPTIRDVLATDVQAAYEGDPSAKSPEEVLLSFPGVKAIVHHRLAHSLHQLGAPVVARIIAEIAHAETGIDIHPGATIGRSFFIDHGTGVVIGETAVIGERVRLYQAVTLGAKRFTAEASGRSLVKGLPRHPIVEDDVVIYAGATVLGRVTVGRGSVIGGNVWLTRSVPANSNVVQAQTREETFDGGAGI